MNTSQSSSNDPAGLFSDHLVSSIPLKSPIPAVDNHKKQYVFSDGDHHEFIKSDTEHNAWNELYWKHRDISRFELKRIDALMTDNHRSDADVWNLNQLHKADNCSNCGKFVCGKCKVHKYSMPYLMIECEQWEYRGKKI